MNQTTEPIRLLLDVVRNTGDFLGTSFVAARDRTAVVFSAKDGAAGLDDAARAAREQLSGTLRTAFAVGATVQSGLVDTASGVLNALAVARPAPEYLGTSSPRT